MNIHKYIIKESHELFTYVFNICDQDEDTLSAIRVSSLTGKIKPFIYDGAAYEIKKESALSTNKFVFKDGVNIGTINQKNFTYKFRIFTEMADYTIKSNYKFKDITVLHGMREVGKVSRKTHWFTSSFGIALLDTVDPILVILTMILKLSVMRAGMAA